MGLQRRHLLIATATATGALTLDLSRPGAALAEGHPVDADGQPIPVPLDELMNNNGIGTVSGDANLDGSGYGFPADSLPSGSVTAGGVPYDFPVTTSAGQNDNVVALGQTIALPAGRYLAGYLLATSTYGATSGTVTVHYSDGTSSTATISVPDWYASGGAVSAPTRYSPGGTDNHPVSIYAVQVWLDPARTATGLTLPTTAAPAPNVSSLHIFALTLQPVIVGSAVGLRDIASTTGWLSLPGGRRAQIVRATVTNLGTEPITRANQLRVSVTAPGVQTVVPARITSLATGEEARIQIGVTSPDLAPGSPVTGSVKVTGRDVSARQSAPLTAGIPPYTRDVASLSQHTAPELVPRRQVRHLHPLGNLLRAGMGAGRPAVRRVVLAADEQPEQPDVRLPSPDLRGGFRLRRLHSPVHRVPVRPARLGAAVHRGRRPSTSC